MRLKLTQSQADEIRRLYDAGGTSQHQLARMFGVSQHSVWEILKNKRYAQEGEAGQDV